jgi:hypothetical protein
MDPRQLFSERLKTAMTAAGLDTRPTTLEKLFNLHYPGRSVTYHGVRGWLIGLSIPEQDKLEVLAELLGTDVAELRYGHGKVRGEKTRSKSSASTVDIHDRIAIDAFLRLPKQSRNAVRQVIHALAKCAGSNGDGKD